MPYYAKKVNIVVIVAHTQLFAIVSIRPFIVHVTVQRELLKRIYGVFYPWAKKDNYVMNLVEKINGSCVIYTNSTEKVNRVIVEFLLKMCPLERNFIKLESSDIIADYLARDLEIIDEVLPKYTVITVGNLVMPNKQEVNLVAQFIKDHRRESQFIVVCYNRVDLQKYAKSLHLQEYSL